MYLLWMKNNISVAKSPFLQEFQIHLSTSLHRKKFRCIKLTSKKLLKVELNISVTNFGLLEQKGYLDVYIQIQKPIYYSIVVK